MFSFEEIIPTYVKHASFGMMVGLIVRPGKSEGEIGEKGGNRLGGAFFIRLFFAGLPFNNVFSLGFLHGSATVAMRNNERGKYAASSTKDAFIISFAWISSFSFLLL